MENAFTELGILRDAAVRYEWNNEFLKAALIWQFYRELFSRANPTIQSFKED